MGLYIILSHIVIFLLSDIIGNDTRAYHLTFPNFIIYNWHKERYPYQHLYSPFPQLSVSPCKLREVELSCGQGKTIAEAVRQAGVSEQTYYRWRQEYGGMNTSDAKRMKELEKENARLKKLVADRALDIAILKDVNSKNF